MNIHIESKKVERPINLPGKITPGNDENGFKCFGYMMVPVQKDICYLSYLGYYIGYINLIFI